MPYKKRLGYTDDSRVVALCDECHSRCHGLVVNGKQPIAEEQQHEWVRENQLHFFKWASPAMWSSYGVDRSLTLDRLIEVPW